MKIRKSGSAQGGLTDPVSELEAVNQFTKAQLTEEEVYLFSVLLCDNEVDRDFECFTLNALEKLSGLFVGRTGQGHDRVKIHFFHSDFHGALFLPVSFLFIVIIIHMARYFVKICSGLPVSVPPVRTEVFAAEPILYKYLHILQNIAYLYIAIQNISIA